NRKQMMMENFNGTSEDYFILLSFSNWPHLEVVLFVLILVFYLMTLIGNMFIIVLSYLDSHLHTPMYSFLSNLSFLDLCYTTSSLPQLLVNLWGSEKTISYAGCMVQLYFVLALGATECILLVVMSYDRYAAVCRPLHYTVLMHPGFCHLLAVASWLTLMVTSSVFVPVRLILIFTSYGAIARAVLRMQSTIGLQKIFRTCGAHLMVVSLFFIPVMCIYLQPSTENSQDR
ncbi:Hypothetical predicted protein, partial [Marmota monax]